MVRLKLYVGNLEKKGFPTALGVLPDLRHGLIPAEYIIGEIYRLGSSMAIVSRSFCNVKEDYESIEKIFKKGVRDIRSFEEKIRKKDYRYFLKNQRILKKRIAEIEESLTKGREIK